MEKSTSQILKVVIVDDSFIVAERLKCVLDEINYINFSGNANDISSAYKLIDSVNPDVIILDIKLLDPNSGKTGIDFLSELRQNLPQIKVIIFTNNNELHYRLICLEMGVNCFFDKSKGADKITEVLKQWTIKN